MNENNTKQNSTEPNFNDHQVRLNNMRKCLTYTNGNITKAHILLGLERRTVQRWVKRYEIKTESYKEKTTDE